MAQRCFVDNEGGDSVIQMAGRTELQCFGKQSTRNGLSERLDSWQHLFLSYGGVIGPTMARTMLLGWIPSDLRQEVLRNDKLTNVAAIVDYIKSQLAWDHSETLAREKTRSQKQQGQSSVSLTTKLSKSGRRARSALKPKPRPSGVNSNPLMITSR